MAESTQLDRRKYQFYRVAPASDLPVGERLQLEVDGEPIVIFNIEGKFYAVDDLCTHDLGPLGDGDVEGYEIICPRHGARFDVRTGKATRLPAVKEIAIYPVRIVDDFIEIGLAVS